MWNDRIPPCMHDWLREGCLGRWARVLVHTDATVLVAGQLGSEPGAHRLSNTAGSCAVP